MGSPKPRSSKRAMTPRITISNPDLSLNYSEELLYTYKLPDTTSDLQRPRAASESAFSADEVEVSSISRPANVRNHEYGRPCPDHDEQCHYHHQLTQHCHVPWLDCPRALNAVKQSYRAGDEWIGAPKGWNKEHESCLTTTNKCHIHAQLQGMPLEKQRNKKYPEKPRVRGRHSRGTSSQKKEDKKVDERPQS